MVDWIKGGRGIPSGPVWPFVKMWNKPYYNEGDMIAAMPGGISIIGTPGERITPIHDPWCGYWPLQVPFAYPWYPYIRWLSCPQAVLYDNGNKWFITTDQNQPTSTFWIQEYDPSLQEFTTIYTNTLPNIRGTETTPAVWAWGEVEIDTFTKGTKKVIALLKMVSGEYSLAEYVDVYVFDGDTLQFHTKIMNDSSFVRPIYNSKYALIDSEDNIHIFIYTYTDEILKAYDYRSTDGGETFTAYLVNDFDMQIDLGACFCTPHIGRYITESPDGILWVLTSYITMVYDEVNKVWTMENHAQLFKSVDFGETWVEQSTIAVNVITEGIRDFNIIDGVFYAIDTSGRYNDTTNPWEVYIKRSTDGINWTNVLTVDRVNAEKYLGASAFAYDGTYYYAIMCFSDVNPEANVVYRSSDGISWEIISEFEGSSNPTDYKTTASLAVTGDGRLSFTHWHAEQWVGPYKQMVFWESEDYGATWTAVPAVFRDLT